MLFRSLRLSQRRNREERSGRLMGGPYWAQPVESDAHLASCLRYLPMNPVKAGLCPQPVAWRFGSYRALLGLEDCPSWLVRERVLRFVSRGPEEFDQWVRSAKRVPDPPRSKRDLNRFEVECRLLDGQSCREIAHAVGLSLRSVRRFAATWREG